jgi:hypothetical protein
MIKYTSRRTRRGQIVSTKGYFRQGRMRRRLCGCKSTSVSSSSIVGLGRSSCRSRERKESRNCDALNRSNAPPVGSGINFD